jgi:predicted AlkP superfamily phosphohydrolase/phosphomutase
MGSERRKLVLLGWDGADWKVIHPLLDAGYLPHLASLIERGVMGSIASLTPMMSPMLWTSIVTGVTAERHGVLGFIEPDPVTGGVRPTGALRAK